MAEETSKEVAASPPRRRVGPMKFVQEVRSEAGKVTWPSIRETYLTTIMVFLMVVIAMVFFAVVDYALGLGLNFLLGV